MDWFILWLIFSVIVGIGAGGRGRNGFGWFVLSLIISPLLAVILLALLPRVEEEQMATSLGIPNGDQPEPWKTRTCPFCAEIIKIEAIKCKHCGSEVEPIRLPTRDPADVDDGTLNYLVRKRFPRLAGLLHLSSPRDPSG